MSLLFGLRFDFRNPAEARTTLADRYAAGVDMADWADRLGCVSIALQEHHCSPDGYLPSPLPLVAALLAPFYEPLRLAEDMLVLDHLSRGRVDLIVAAGYVPTEFSTYGVPLSQRVPRVTEVIRTLKG